MKKITTLGICMIMVASTIFVVANTVMVARAAPIAGCTRGPRSGWKGYNLGV